MANPAVTEIAEDFDDALQETSLRVAVKPIAIRPVAQPASIPKAAPPKRGRGSPRPFFTESLNSRTGGEVGKDPWKLRWKSDLKAGLNAGYILQAGDRVLVSGEYEWQLLDREGKALADGGRGAGELVMDAASGRFYVPDTSGTIAAYTLADGRRAFAMNAFSGSNYRRSLILPHATRLLVASIEYVQQPHSLADPTVSAIEVYEMGAGPEVNQYGLLTSAEVKARLTRGSTLLLAAARDESVVLAVDDRLFLADWDLKVKGVLTGKFTPLALSLDEEARMYVVARAEDKQVLWIVTPQGERLAAYELPADAPPVLTPPAVGYDHRVFLVAGERQIAVSPEGKLLWQTSTPGKVVRLAVTADDHLLVAGGNQIVAIPADGEAKPLFTFEGDTLATAPVMTPEGDLLVASASRLYCLSARPPGTR